MMPLAGEPMLWRVLERLHRCKVPHHIVAATTEKSEDDVLVGVAERSGTDVCRGSENDLVERHLQAAALYGADVMARFPADNPTPEPAVIDATIEHHIASGNDFTSTFPDGFKNGYPDGIGCEVYSVSALRAAAALTSDPLHREHPHRFFYENPERFRIGTMECPQEYRRPDIVLDVNTLPQYQFMARLYEALYPVNPEFGIMDIVAWCDSTTRKEDSG